MLVIDPEKSLKVQGNLVWNPDICSGGVGKYDF